MTDEAETGETNLQVVMPCMNSLEEIEDAFRTLSRQKGIEADFYPIAPPESFRPIEDLASRYLVDDYRIQVIPRSRGLPRMLNEVAEPDRYDSILFLNDDIVMEDEDMTAKLLKTVQETDIGVAGPISVVHETGKVNSAGFHIGRFEFINLHGGEEPGSLSGTQEVPVLEGVALMTDSEAFESSGGFPESFHIYVDDFEFCRRIKAEDYRVVCNRDAEIRHKFGRDDDRERQIYYAVRNGIYFRKKYYSRPVFILNSFFSLFYYLQVLLYWARRRRPDLMKTVLKGLRAAFSGFDGSREPY